MWLNEVGVLWSSVVFWFVKSHGKQANARLRDAMMHLEGLEKRRNTGNVRKGATTKRLLKLTMLGNWTAVVLYTKKTTSLGTSEHIRSLARWISRFHRVGQESKGWHLATSSKPLKFPGDQLPVEPIAHAVISAMFDVGGQDDGNETVFGRILFEKKGALWCVSVTCQKCWKLV